MRPDSDDLLVLIADYVCDQEIESHSAYETARYDLLDSLGCAVLALNYPECTRLLGPVLPGTQVPNGSRVPGTPMELDPVTAAFNIGCLIRWLDFNDTWLAAEWGHPSDNLGAILALADHLSRWRAAHDQSPLPMRDLLTAMIKAHEIQGGLALDNSFNRVGLDHVLLVRIASAAVATWLWGGNRDQLLNAVSNAWLDGGALRTYRHAPNTGTRKSWAAGDATSRGLWLAWLAIKGEMGYPSPLTAKNWGFCDALFRGNRIRLAQPLGSYVMENVLFKISFPAEFHGQTAVEAALQLHSQVKDRLETIEKIVITTQESAMRIINKSGPLHNPADRDHCLQYMVAVALLHGELTSDHYQEPTAQDPRIDKLRLKMVVREDPNYSRDYLDPNKRSIPNAVQVFFRDGTATDQIEVHYPLGHQKRRDEGFPLLLEKFKNNLATQFTQEQIDPILELALDPKRFDHTPVNQFIDLFLRLQAR